MNSKLNELRVNLQPPAFPAILSRNGGVIEVSNPREEMLAYAAWYIVICAHKALQEVPAQVSFEGDTDQTVNLRAIADSTALAYGFTDLNEVMVFMPELRRYCTFVRGLTWDDRFQAWLDSGGRAYDTVTREPDKI